MRASIAETQPHDSQRQNLTKNSAKRTSSYRITGLVSLFRTQKKPAEHIYVFEQIQQQTMSEPQQILYKLSAESDDGISNAKFRNVPRALPTELQLLSSNSNGDDAEWQIFLEQAATAAQFQCNPLLYLLVPCLFFANVHNKAIRPKMEALCEEWNNNHTLFSSRNVVVRYEFNTRSEIVNYSHQPGHAGKTLVTTHDLIFSQKN